MKTHYKYSFSYCVFPHYSLNTGSNKQFLLTWDVDLLNLSAVAGIFMFV